MQIQGKSTNTMLHFLFVFVTDKMRVIHLWHVLKEIVPDHLFYLILNICSLDQNKLRAVKQFPNSSINKNNNKQKIDKR